MAGVIDLMTYKATITADDSKFSAVMDKAGEKAEKFKGKVGNLTKFLKLSLAAGVAAAGASLVAFGKQAMDTADKFDKMAQRTQMSTDRLQELEYIASQNGTSMDVLEKSMVRLNKSMGDALNGSKRQADAFAKLGVSITDANGNMRDSGEVWDEVIRKMQNMENESERNSLAMDLMGKSAIEMAPMLNMSNEAMDEMAQKAHDMGMVMDESAIKAGVQLTDTIDTFKRSLGGIANQLGAQILPLINTLLQWIVENMPTITAFISSSLSTVGNVIGFAIDIINSLINTFKNMATSNSESFNNIKNTILRVIYVIQEYIKTFIEVISKLWDKYGEDILAITRNVFNMIKGIIEGVLNIITGIFQVFTGILTGDWEKVGEGLKNITLGIWKAIESIFNNGIEAIKNIIRLSANVLKDLSTYVMNMLWEGFKFVWESISTWFSNIFNGLFDWFKGLYKGFKNIGKDIFNSLWDGLKSTWKSIKSWVSDTVSWLRDKLAFWRKSKDKMDSDNINTSSNSISIPAYATGTTFVPSDQLAYIHKGEAVIPAEYNPFNPNSRYALGGTVTLSIDKLINVEGNVDKSVMPELRRESSNVLGQLKRMLDASGVKRKLDFANTL